MKTQLRASGSVAGMAERSNSGFSMLATGLGAACGRLAGHLMPSSMIDTLQRYTLAHRRQSIEGLEKLAQQPVSTFFIVLVLGITLAIPAGAVMVFAKAWHLAQIFQPQPRAVVYFDPAVPLEQVNQSAERWQHIASVAEVQVVDRDMGLQLYMSTSGIDPELVTGLGDNPLPHVTRVVLNSWSEASAKDLQTMLSDEAGVQWVQLDLLWLQRFDALQSLAQHFLWLLVWSLGAVVVLIVANTVRLAIEHRRQDIVVAKLVGATNAFVRRPFLYMGFVLGLASGFSALILLKFGGIYLAKPFEQLLSAYAVGDQPFLWRWVLVGVVLGGAALLGWLGAWFAARRHIAAIEPR